MKLVVAVGGASGSIYANRLLDVLAALPAAKRPEVLKMAPDVVRRVDAIYAELGLPGPRK